MYSALASAVLEVPRMKKTLPKRKLELRRATIANLTGPALRFVVGGLTGTSGHAGVDSVMNGDKLEPCMPPSADPDGR
jgi:hypothetical protein